MATIINISPDTFESQDYSEQDESLLNVITLDTTLSSSNNIEFHVYSLNKELITSIPNFLNYTVNPLDPTSITGLSSISISPEDNLKDLEIYQGEYVTYYNFLNDEIGNINESLFISEISSDRTEIRLEPGNNLNNLPFIEQAEDFIEKREFSDYFIDFHLNFFNNNLILANNIELKNEETTSPSILVKLYEPLPTKFNLKSLLYLATSINSPIAYQVSFTSEVIVEVDYNPLQGPNFNIPIKSEVNNSSQELSYNDILNSSSTSSQNQIESLLSQSAINISVDYNIFSDFIHFSSVQTRIENFYYKVGLIETYTSQSNSLINVTGSSTSQLIFNKKTTNVITNFDKFEYFMYYNSGSANSYPKVNSSPPYILYPTTSSQALTWLGSPSENSGNYGGLLLSASNYDNGNPDQLLKTIPEYLREDPANQPYDLFVDMVAQYYDNVWLYTKDVTQKYNADNRLDFGISKDLVSDAIKDFGVKLYQNNFSNQELYTAFLGITPGGSLFPFPEITGSMPVPTGFEFVDTLISASNDIISMDDTNKSLYKRLYHNIPYLLKSKGTTAGLRALITSYGIPDTILRISEFGGKDQVNANDYDLYFNNFNYALKVGPEANYISSSFLANPSWNSRPQTVEFRFKPEKLTTTTSPYGLTNLSQSLFTLENEFGTPQYLDIVLEYSGSGLSTGSYSGAPKDPNYQYGNLKLIPNTGNPSTSASISLPFFNGDWWSVMLTSNLSTGLTLSTGNKIYNGNDGTSLGFYDTASIIAGNPWSNSNKSYFSTGSLYPGFSGSLQEVRYYKPIISQSVFKDYIMNPLSFEGNGINSAPDQLIFRAALGSELDINTSSSIHPRVTGSWTTTSSFASDSKFYFNNSPSYSKNTEYFFLDQPAVGIKNRITDKIRSENDTIPSGNVLSAIRPLSQVIEASASYTDNINYLEVAFSPQNQINDDIIGQMGHFNIGDYIGDPAQRFTGDNYPDLNNLSEEYFKKYIKQYDLTDFVRLIKFFDNSLFKMIKDFIPTRTSLASGLVVKQHLLERNKYPQPQVSTTNESELSGSIEMVRIQGGSSGVFNPYNISYDLDFFSGSQQISNVVSGSGSGYTFSNNDTFISSSLGTFSTNAVNLSFFSTVINVDKSIVPNLWVGLEESNGTLVPNSFNSGSSSTSINTNVSASGIASYNSLGNVFNSVANFTNATNFQFPKFTSEGYIQFTEDIFDTGGGISGSKSQITSITSTPGLVQITTALPTASILTQVSASLGDLSLNVGSFASNRYSYDTAVTNASNIFSNFNPNSNSFRAGGFISASANIFTNSSGISTDKSPILVLSSTELRTTFVTASVDNNYNLSFSVNKGTFTGQPSRYTATSVTSNAPGGINNTTVDFIGRGFIEATTVGGVAVNIFETAGGNPTNLSPMSALSDAANGVRPTLIENTSAFPIEEVYRFIIRSGSVSNFAGSTTIFPTQTPGVLPSPTNFIIYSGSYDDDQPTPSTTFISSSIRDISNESFTIHSGSTGNDLGTAFLSSSFPSLTHDYAHISNISNNIINFNSNYSINSVGSTATKFQFYNSSLGNVSTFISTSILDISKEDYYYVTPPQYNVTQSWSVTTPSLSGSVTTIHRSQDEFYNGELSGSRIEVTNGELNPHCEKFKTPNFTPANYKLRLYYEEEGYNETAFLSNQNIPFNGFISLFYGTVPSFSNLAPEAPSSDS